MPPAPRARAWPTPIIAGLFAGTAHATVFEIAAGTDVRSAVAGLRAGDELVLRGGTYTFGGGLVIAARGTVDAPIVIRGKAGETVILTADTEHNVVEVDGSRYLVLKNLRITGGSHGVRIMNSDYVTLEDSEVYETGDVAVSANAGGTYEGLVIRRNHIHHTNGTGEGIYFGCNNDTCRVANSTIEWNYIHHTNRAGVEQGDGIEIKEGSYGNTIRHNVIHDTNYPAILTYSTAGNGAPNVIEANIVWNTNDFAIQSAADAIIRNNIVLGAPIGLQSHQAGSPSNQVVAHNTVVGAGIEVRNVTGPIVIANNAIYSNSGPAINLISGNLAQVTLAGNVGMGGLSGAGGGFSSGNGIAADFASAIFNAEPPLSLFPKPGSALIGAGSAAYAVVEDFNGTPRDGTVDVGAYRFSPQGNPGWTLAAERKTDGR